MDNTKQTNLAISGVIIMLPVNQNMASLSAEETTELKEVAWRTWINHRATIKAEEPEVVIQISTMTLLTVVIWNQKATVAQILECKITVGKATGIINTVALESWEVLDIIRLNSNLTLRRDTEDKPKSEVEVLLGELTWVMISPIVIRLAMVTVIKRFSRISGSTIITTTNLEELAKIQLPTPTITIGNHSILIICKHLSHKCLLWAPQIRVMLRVLIRMPNAMLLNISNNPTNNKDHPQEVINHKPNKDHHQEDINRLQAKVRGNSQEIHQNGHQHKKW